MLHCPYCALFALVFVLHCLQLFCSPVYLCKRFSPYSTYLILTTF